MKRIRNHRFQRLTLTLLSFFVLSVVGVLAQVSVTGKVIGSDNLPLPGVNVTIKGTTTGTITDLDGNYSISVKSEEDILVYSMIGMLAEEVTVGNQTTIEISLVEDMVGLEEIVVVGYGTMKKSDVTGSIVSLKEDDLTQVKSTNVIESLQGKAAGVDISRNSGEAGSSFTVKIRGERSLSGNNDPLYIVDGIQYGKGVDINPSDIASIEILKDVSSTAIYGSKGANGVVIITTKKGIEGQTKITFSHYTGINKPLGELPYMNSSDYLSWKDDYARTKEYDATGIWDESIKADLKEFEEKGVANGTDTDWLDEIQRTGYLKNYFLSVAGGKSGMAYNLSLDHTNEKGMLDQDDFKRYVLRGGFDVKVTDFLSVGTSSILSYYNRSRMSFPEKTIRQMSPLAVPYDSLGELITSPVPTSDALNPLWYYQDGFYDREEIKSRIFSSVYADVQIVEGLKFRSTFNADISNKREGLSKKGGQDDVQVELYTTPARDITWTNMLSFNKTVGGIHHFNIMAAQELQKGNQERYRITGQNPVIPYSKWYALDGMEEISVSLDPDETGDDVFYYTEKSLVSYLGRFNYSLLSKYILTASIRADGASVLAEGNKWDYFPAVSVAWNIREESFIQPIDFISSMKLRLGYGVSGNYHVPTYSSIDRTNTAPLYYEFGASESVSYGYRPVFAGNPYLTWEKTASSNIGFDFGFLQNRITGNIDAYVANTTNLLQDRKLPAHTAIPSIYDNIGEVETRGIELMLHTVNISKPSGGFQWSTDISFSRNKEEILSIAGGVTKDVSNGWFVGEGIDVHYDLELDGMWQFSDSSEMALYPGTTAGDMKFVDQNNDTVITDDDRVVLGSERPDWYGSFNNRFEYKGFDLSIMIMARMGQMIKDKVMTQSQVTDIKGENGMKVDYWTANNPSNESPRFDPDWTAISYYPNASALEYTDGSWVKVRDITLGYTLPSDLMSKINVSSLRFYVSLKNYFVLYSPFYDKGRYDPEMEGRTNWPVPKTMMFGVNLEF